MKKTLSVFLLAARALGPGALLAILGSAGLSALFFALAAREGAGLEQVLSQRGCALSAGLGLVGVCASLTLPLCDLFGSHPGLTLRRLRLSERAATLVFAAFGALCLLLLACAHICALFLLSAPYGAQARALAFLRTDFAHSLLPVGDAPRIARNLLLCLALGLAAARFSYRQRRGRKPLALPLLLSAVLVGFSRGGFGTWEQDLLLGLFALLVLAHQLYALFAPEEEAEEEEGGEEG